jgi:hypothetical protein
MESGQRPVSSFVDAVERVGQALLTRVYEEGDLALSYGLDRERLGEAELVAPCAQRFAHAETLPDDERPAVGRYARGALQLGPPLGRLLRKQVSRAGDGATTSLYGVVLDALATGYVAAVDMAAAHLKKGGSRDEILIRRDRTPEELWNWWVVSFTGGPLDAMDPKYRREIDMIVRDRVTAALNRLGLLPSFRGRTKLIATTGVYATAGLSLRISQSNNLTDEDSYGTWRQATNMWPYAAYSWEGNRASLPG